MKKNIFAVLFICPIMLCVCSKNNTDSDDGSQSLFDEQKASLVLTTKQGDMVADNNAFAFSLLNKISQVEEKSFVFSPLSATYALGMLSQAAGGETREELVKTLGIGTSQEDINQLCLNLLYRGLKQDKGVTINNANLVLASDEIPIYDSYKTAVADYYNALTVSMDMSDSKKTLDYLNSWISNQTRGGIPQMLQDIYGHLFLVNAMYFKGEWKDRFPVADIKDMLFYISSSEYKQEKMLTRLGDLFFGESDSAIMVRIPYGNGTYAMTLILPNQEISLDDYLAAFDSTEWATLTEKNGRMEKVDLAFPKFETTTKLSLKDILFEMGIKSAFIPGGQADYSNMTSSGDLYVERVLQQSTIKVDEKGTVASAATVVEMRETVAPDARGIYHFLANRPFLYCISDTETNAIYFIGAYKG